MDVDGCCVAAALKEGAEVVRQVKRYDLGKRYLRGPAQQAWFLIEKHLETFGELPTLATIQREENDYRVPDEELEPLEFYISELRYRDRQANWSSLGPDIGNLIKDGKLDTARERMKRFIKHEEEEDLVGKEVVRSIFDIAQAVKSRYIDMKEGRIGVPWMWPTMNEITLGSEPGDTNGLIARLGVGKSQALMLNGYFQWKMHGAVVLFISPEMKQISLAQRMFAYHMRLPQGLVRRGRLDELTEAKFFEELDRLQTNEGFFVVDDTYRISCELIEAAIEKVRPTIVYLDGAYLVLYERGMSRQENAEHVAEWMTSCAKRYGVPINYTSQFNRTVQKNDPSTFSAEGIGLSDVFGWTASNLFAMYQTDDMKADREMTFKAMKVRESKGDDEFRVRWDFSTQDFSEVGQEERGAFQDKDYATYGPAGAATDTANPEDSNLPF